MTSLPFSPARRRRAGSADDGDTVVNEPRRNRLLSWLDNSGLDLRNTWQVVAGAILLPLGVAVILLGWAGAAHGRVDQQQIPYLISGGILGLACVVVGCFFFWAHWLYRIYDQADLHHQAAMREQAEFYRQLLQAVGGSGAAAAGSAVTSTNAGTTLVATPTGTNVHTADCPIVANRRDSVRSVSRAEAESMRPCRICEPFPR